MVKCFSDAAETALCYIYYDVRLGKGAEEYRNRNYLPWDLCKAAECYEKCLNQRENTFSKLASANQLGLMYCEGIGVTKNYTKALPLLKLAVEVKYPENPVYYGIPEAQLEIAKYKKNFFR